MSDFPKPGDKVWVKSLGREGKLTGFESDGRARIKLENKPGAPNRFPAEDLRIREIIVESSKLKMTAGWKLPFGGGEVTITYEEEKEKLTISQIE